MIQCLFVSASITPSCKQADKTSIFKCEDWYHTTKCLAKDIQSNKPDDSILHPDSFDTFVCEKCISGPASDTIARYAGTPGFMVLSASGILTSDLAKAQLVQQKVETEAGAANGKKDEGSPSPPALQIATSTSSSLKRPLPIEGNTPKDEDGDEVPSKAKAQKLEHLNSEQKTMQCQAPPVRNEAFLSASLPRKDVYLEDGWRERLCRCVQVSITRRSIEI